MKKSEEVIYLGRLTALTVRDDKDPTLYIPFHFDQQQIDEMNAYIADPKISVMVCVLVQPLSQLDKVEGV